MRASRIQDPVSALFKPRIQEPEIELALTLLSCPQALCLPKKEEPSERCCLYSIFLLVALWEQVNSGVPGFIGKDKPRVSALILSKSDVFACMTAQLIGHANTICQ